MSFESTEYTISIDEMERRKKALLVLVISLCSGFILASLKQSFIDFWITILSTSAFAVILFLIRLFTLTSFKSFSQITISLTDQYLERRTQKLRERFALKDVHRVNVKRTIKGHIREMKISLVSGNSLFINALEDFEQFNERLLANIDRNVKVKEYREPIDYDHHLFYVVFGLVVGLSIPLMISSFVGFNYSVVKNLFFVIAVYVFLVGVYIILRKPISKRYGGNAELVDYLLGSLFVCLGIYIFVS